jgi:transposase InsO family protein
MEVVHLAIDDHSRLAYSEILPDEKRGSCLRFLFDALRFFRSLGVKVERVMTDNGASFRSRRYAKAMRLLKIKHLRTKPKTNGKAERFVQTSLRDGVMPVLTAPRAGGQTLCTSFSSWACVRACSCAKEANMTSNERVLSSSAQRSRVVRRLRKQTTPVARGTLRHTNRFTKQRCPPPISQRICL